jgi:hypothetical protein
MTDVFVSYSVESKKLMEHLKSMLLSTEQFNPIIVPELEMNLVKNNSKVIENLKKCSVFICIINQDSINNQWVNQELGYWIGKNSGELKNIFILLDKKVSDNLKGFITYENDMPYRYGSEQEFMEALQKLREKLMKDFAHYGYYCIH